MTAVWLDIGRSLREAFFMFWETLWPLILGFGLAGVVQAFVSRDAMRRKLGNHRPAAVTRASAYGVISSSCSYAASAMAKALFARGADFVAAMIFMFASTNLVIELGIVLVVLMGWQFAVSEFVGGAIMIVLLASLGGLWLRGRAVVAAQQRLASVNAGTPAEGETSPAAAAGHEPATHAAQDSVPLAQRLRSKSGWANAATYAVADLRMLRRELLIGYSVAGLLAVLVPVSAWHAVFITGHGWWTSLENVIVGPFVAMISFVCSIGNIPLAAALWNGGISMGGVVSFIFADLIALPLLLIYRRYYGTWLTVRMLALFWAIMSVAGLATEGILTAAGIVPPHRSLVIAPTGFAWNYTTYLNIVFLAVFAVLYWAYRHRERLGAGVGYALDPVCGMQVQTAHAPASLVRDGRRIYFCSDHCAHRFADAPQRFSSHRAERASTA